MAVTSSFSKSNDQVSMKYALDDTGVLVSVKNAQKGNKFSCPGCGGAVIPVQGELKAQHYRHLNSDCAYETYLHRTAKITAYERIRKWNQFPLILNRQVTCMSQLRPRFFPDSEPCRFYDEAKYDLSRLFDQVELEKQDLRTGFTPDVGLINTVTGAKCYVEIHVTHPCSDEKIASGVPIIEIHVGGEEDIESIRSSDLNVNSSNVKVYNFSVQERVVDTCNDLCLLQNEGMNKWSINRLGALQKRQLAFSDLGEGDVDNEWIWSADIGSEDEKQRLSALISTTEESFNCISCAHSGAWCGGFIQCKRKSQSVPYTEAQQCIEFKSN